MDDYAAARLRDVYEQWLGQVYPHLTAEEMAWKSLLWHPHVRYVYDAAGVADDTTRELGPRSVGKSRLSQMNADAADFGFGERQPILGGMDPEGQAIGMPMMRYEALSPEVPPHLRALWAIPLVDGVTMSRFIDVPLPDFLKLRAAPPVEP